MSGEPGSEASRAKSLPLVGGALALDFCNTASGRETEGLIEHLRAPEDLIDWCRHAAVIDDGAGACLRDRCAEPGFGPRPLDRAVALRDAIYRLDAALAAGRQPDQGESRRPRGSAHAACLAAGRLTAMGRAFGWARRADEPPEAALLGPIAASALALVARADRARLKRCGGHRCGWLFLDTTKGNNRRWCEMEVCGNRAKHKRRRGRSAGP